jgi:hypothetical protein
MVANMKSSMHSSISGDLVFGTEKFAAKYSQTYQGIDAPSLDSVVSVGGPAAMRSSEGPIV